MKNNRTTKGVVMRTPIEVQASTELGNRRVDSHLGTRAVVNAETEDLIRASVSKQTLTNYKRLIKQVETWLGGRVLDDALLADYISMLHHDEGKAPATISQVGRGGLMAVKAGRSADCGRDYASNDGGYSSRRGWSWKGAAGRADMGTGRYCLRSLSKRADNSWAEGRLIDSIDVRLPPPSG